jgi:hypothetical protein
LVLLIPLKVTSIGPCINYTPSISIGDVVLADNIQSGELGAGFLLSYGLTPFRIRFLTGIYLKLFSLSLSFSCFRKLDSEDTLFDSGSAFS